MKRVCCYTPSLSSLLDTEFYFNFSDPSSIKEATSSAAKSWIGQTVTLKCVSDGVPTPTLTWYKPDGNELNTITAKESTVEVSLNDEQDFGEYECVTYNGLDPSNNFSMTVGQIRRCPYIFQKYTKIIVKRDDLEKSALSSYRKAPFIINLGFLVRRATEGDHIFIFF